MSAPVTPAQAMQWNIGELQSHYDHLSDVISVTMEALIEQADKMPSHHIATLNVVLANAQTGMQVISAEQNRRQNQTN